MLPNYSNILVATDLSQNSVHAFKHAVMMARRNKAKMHLLHVVPEVDAAMRSYISALLVKGSLDRFEAQHEEEARLAMRAELKKFAEEELANHPGDLERLATIEVVHGHPAQQILRAADDLGADVIVMGTHGKGVLEHAFLGSVAEKVLRKARKPVFIIPLPE
jgi:nucleotide-binding universal stress UspA family protein